MEAKAYRQFLDLERKHWWFRGRRTVYFGLLRHHLNGSRPARVLDLGCGMGGFMPGLREIGEEVFGSDVSVESLTRCRERGFRSCVASSGYSLPFMDGSFDLVCLFDAIEHIEDDRAVMGEVARVLRPGGLVLVTVPAYQFLYANNDRVAQHIRRYRRTRLRELFTQAGLATERNTYSNVFLFPIILPTVIALKIYEIFILRRQIPTHTNLSWPLPGFVQSLLYRVFATELPFSKRFNWPAGHSILAIARRPRS